MDLDRSSVARTLAAAGCIAPDEEAEELIRAAAGDAAALADLVRRRAMGEPVAWLTGAVTFCDVRVRVLPGVYVPRWQTEPLARRAASLLPPGGVAVDLCTGSGAIAVVLAAAVPSARVVATELDDTAVACARANGVEVFARVPGRATAALPRRPRRCAHGGRAVRADRRAAVCCRATSGRSSRGSRSTAASTAPTCSPRSCGEARDGSGPAGGSCWSSGAIRLRPSATCWTTAGFETPEVLVDEEGDPRAICARRS